ncbi:hypothetical protein [Kiloniella sp.]|uniref:hypothetical protein n=1 Tax=Kiloniella sp. TaxID=1938587 RepID=UPI003B024F54
MDKIVSHTLRYPLFDIYWDYAKTSFGLLIGAGGVIYGSDNLISILFFGAILIIFSFFGLQSYQRHKSLVKVDQEGLSFTSWKQKEISWKSINNIELRYFGRPIKDKDRDQKPKGVLHLTLKTQEEKITIDSSLYGFRYLVWCATQAAKEYKAPLDPGTVGNMLDIGLDPDGDSEMPDPHTAGI